MPDDSLQRDQNRENWKRRVVAYTLAMSLLVGALLGELTAWLVNTSLTDGMLSGDAMGGAFDLFMAAVLGTAEQRQRPSESTACSEE